MIKVLIGNKVAAELPNTDNLQSLINAYLNLMNEKKIPKQLIQIKTKSRTYWIKESLGDNLNVQ